MQQGSKHTFCHFGVTYSLVFGYVPVCFEKWEFFIPCLTSKLPALYILMQISGWALLAIRKKTRMKRKKKEMLEAIES